MKFSDLFIDLNDLWGRIVPGLFVLADLYLGLEFVHPIDLRPTVDFLGAHTFFSSVLLAVIVLVALVLGELVLYPVFRLRWLLPRRTAMDLLQELDVTKDKKIIAFYEERFNEESLNSSLGPLPTLCKSLLLHECPQAYAEARKIEARTNLKGGMILPMLALAVLSAAGGKWLLLAVSGTLFLVFFSGFKQSPAKECEFLFRAYYNCVDSRRCGKEGVGEVAT